MEKKPAEQNSIWLNKINAITKFWKRRSKNAVQEY